MASPKLRTPSSIRIFKSEIKEALYDLREWRQITRLRPDLSILDCDGAKGWDLATQLISESGFLRRGRLSTSAALRHPYFLLAGDQAAAIVSKFTVANIKFVIISLVANLNTVPYRVQRTDMVISFYSSLHNVLYTP